MSDTVNHMNEVKPEPASSALELAIAAATDALLACQRPDGHWVFELEADATIPAEYVLLRHYLGEPVDAALEAKIAAYLRRIQGAHGGWPLFHDGDLDVSATVKAYFALKMIGDSVDADAHATRAREALRARGGAERANVFTRIMLALFGFIPWRAVPMMPVEIMLLPTVVSDPSRQDVLLEPHRHRAAAGADGEAAGCAQRQRRAYRRAFSRFAGKPRPSAESATAEAFVVLVLPWRRQCVARDRAVAVAPASLASTRDRSCRRLGRRAPQRRGRAWRDLSGNGQQRDDVRRAWAIRKTIRERAIARRSVEKLLVVQRRTRPIASLASRRFGTRRLSAHALLEAGDAARRARRPKKASTGSCRCRFSMCAATGSRGDPRCGPAAGRFNTPIRYYPDVDDTAVVAMAMDRIQKEVGA